VVEVDNPGRPAINIPTRLVIESVGIDSKIISVGWNVIQKDGQEYSIWQVADYAVGWHQTTAGLGDPGNTVMAGHHNVNGEVFRDLVNVERGDKVIVYSNDKKFEYVVDMKTIVKEKGEPVEVRRRNAQWIAPTNDERLTFVTCWPYTNNTHRVIVVVKPL
jgi:sortase A